jgi:lysophospholipase L1-like esterase
VTIICWYPAGCSPQDSICARQRPCLKIIEEFHRECDLIGWFEIKFYNFIDAGNVKDYDFFIEQVKSTSICNTGKTSNVRTAGKMQDSRREPEHQNAMQLMLKRGIAEKKACYAMLNHYAKQGQIVFSGSSLMEFFPIGEMQSALKTDEVIYNRGIAGATTADLLDALDVCIFQLAPSKIFINIGSNDIGMAGSFETNFEKLLSNYSTVMDRIKDRLPECLVYVMAYYPVNSLADFGLDARQKAEMFRTRTNANITKANDAVRSLAQQHGFRFIDVNSGLSDDEGNLKKEYSTDGVHLRPNAYEVILENMRKYIQIQ